jgi:hydrogenase maturation protease
MHKTLVLGVGNYLMGDEGVGCHAIAYLEKLGYTKYVDLLDGGTGGFHLMEHLTDHEQVILIDAVLDNKPEGTVRVIRPKVSSDFPHHMSTHEIGLKDLITSLLLTEQLPDIYLIAVSVKDYDELGITLSRAIARTLPEIEQRVGRILEKIKAKQVVS